MLRFLVLPSRVVFATLALSFLAAPAALPVHAGGLDEGEVPPAVRAALVQVEASVQTAEGEEPTAAGWAKRCPKCGEYHINELDNVLREERPAAVAGYLVAPDRVLASDPMIHPRFVREWRVRLGDETVAAHPVAWAIDRKAALFALDHPLKAGRPLAFSATAAGPYSLLTYSREKNGWSTLIQPAGGGWLVLADGRRFRTTTADSLVLAADGSPVAPTCAEIVPPGDGWKASYTTWPWLDEAAYREGITRVEHTASASILHATLQLRPVPVEPGQEEESFGGNSDDDSKATTLEAAALVLGPQRVLVLKGMAPGVTARLETVRLALPGGGTMDARFVASVTEFGALVVETAQPLPNAVTLATAPWSEQRDRLLFSAEVRVKGEERRAYVSHLRSIAVETGFKGREVPSFARKADDLFIFDQTGLLIGIPIAKRAQPGGERWNSSPDPFTLQAGELAKYTGDTAAWADATNTPRSAAEERRLAWLGVELQPLDRELAQAHGVAAQTDNGSNGALVTFVYPDSPAARAGLANGDVLLRVLPSGTHRALQVRSDSYRFADTPFPWDRYDQIPDEYLDRIPRPWVSAETALGKMLKDIGFGAAYTLDYARDGKVATLPMTVERAPDHYGSAPEAVAAAYGMHLRELTFETRRFYQIAAGEPGLIVARVEAGGPASVAGLKPYEVVTTVDDKPVTSVAEFEAAIAAAKPLRLGVRRMHQVRLVTVTPVKESITP
jgi:serine protease Do